MIRRLLFLSFLNACSSGAPVGVGEQQAATTGPVQGELMFVDSAGQKRETVYEVSGTSVNLPIQLTRGQVSDFSFGYTDKHPQIELRAGQVVLNAPSPGTYHVAVLARHRKGCVDGRIGQCEIDNRQVTRIFPQVDLQTSVVIRIVNPADLNPSGVGQGGGFVGQILRGEGLIGSLAKMFTGGGGLFGGTTGAGAQSGQAPQIGSPNGQQQPVIR